MLRVALFCLFSLIESTFEVMWLPECLLAAPSRTQRNIRAAASRKAASTGRLAWRNRGLRRARLPRTWHRAGAEFAALSRYPTVA